MHCAIWTSPFRHIARIGNLCVGRFTHSFLRGPMRTFGLFALIAVVAAVNAPASAQAPDVIATFGDDGGTNYFLNSFTPASANLGATGGTPDPTLNLVIGKRYQFTNSLAHPFIIS